MDCDPLAGLMPDQAPEALQDRALAAFQRKVALPPLATVLGAAARDTVGSMAFTDTVAVCTAVP